MIKLFAYGTLLNKEIQIELFGKDESLNFLKCGGQITDEQIVFSKTNRKSYNRFLKYLYQYLK